MGRSRISLRSIWATLAEKKDETMKRIRVRRIFKYTKSEFVVSLQTYGRIRVGTAYEFRTPDGLTGARSDVDEGTAVWAPGDHLERLHKDHPFLRHLESQGIPIHPDADRIQFKFASGTEFKSQGNMFVLSFCMEISPPQRRRMLHEFGHDVCFRVDDIRGIFDAISSHSLLRGRTRAQGPVIYEWPTPTTFRPPSPWYKAPVYRWQREWRMVWGGSDIPNEGVLIDVPAIIPLIRFTKLGNDGLRQIAKDL